MWCAWVGLAVALTLTEAATVELTAQYSSSTCSGPPTLVTVKEATSCVASSCSKGIRTAATCSSEDNYRSAVSNLFGSTPFLIRESYDDANCTAFQSATAFRLDTECVLDGATRMFVRSQLASNGSISVQYFADASCSQGRLHHADFVPKGTAEQHFCDSNALRWYVSKRDRRLLAQTASSTDEEEGNGNTGTEGTDATTPPVADEEGGDTDTNATTDEEDPNAGTATSKSADNSRDEDEADMSKSSDTGSDTVEPTPTPTEAPTTEAPTTEPPTTAPRSTTAAPTTTKPPTTTSAPDATEAPAATSSTPKVKKVSSTAGGANASTTSTASSTPSSKTDTMDEATEDSVKDASASGSKAVATSSGSSNGMNLTLIGVVAGCIALAIIILALVVRRLRAEHKSFHNATPAPATARREVRDPYAMQTSPFQPQRHTQRRYTTLAQKPYLLQVSTDEQPGQQSTQSQTIQQQPNALENSVSGLVAPAKQKEMWNDEVIVASRIPKEKLQVQELISRGAFEEVYSGTYDRRRVAVKMLPPQMRLDVQQVNGFLTKAKLAATMRHPHIVSFIGVAWSALSDACVVMEFMDGGDLRSLLDDYEATRHPVGFDNEKTTIAMHVCQALAYMHTLSTPTIHRDLRSRNILLNQNMEAKLKDFGISREKLDETMTAGVGTSVWIAPEVLMGNSYDDKADIFSFGVVLSELDTHQLPYATATDGEGSQMVMAEMLPKVVAGTMQVEFSQQACQTMAELGRACTSVDPTQRPKAAEILYILQDVLSEELLECSL